jgi:23S rRNA (cytosine1962-C5)-methyltransferase
MSEYAPMDTVVVTKRGADRIRGGHLWIYKSDLVNRADIPGGAIVAVHDPHANFVGQAFFSDRSEIALRLLTRSDEPIDRKWWLQRIRSAAQRREKISANTNAYRLLYSEGDLVPSLIIDRYDDVLVLQTLSQGADAIKSLIAELLVEEFTPRAIVERNDVRVRALEGLPMLTGTIYGNTPDELVIEQHGVHFVVAPFGGQKTGSFLDQRENRLAARNVAYGRGLDCFTFTGAFALYLKDVCDSVLGIDISAEAIAGARRNAELNNASHVGFREANVFDALREFEESGERFETIILDPPAFAKNRASIHSAARGYKEINLRAMKLLNPGGILVTCTCSYHISEKMFLDIIAESTNDARRRFQLLEKRMQSSDHPVLVGVPETHYLKCVIARVID